MGDPQEDGEETFLSSKEMDNRPLGSKEQFSGMISKDPDLSIIWAGGANRSISSLDIDASIVFSWKIEIYFLNTDNYTIFFIFSELIKSSNLLMKKTI